MSGDSPSLPSDPFRIVGTLLARKYRVDRVVAHGGFGVVYAGRHIELDVPIAVKLLKPAGDVDFEVWGELLDQFLQEAKTLAKLRHPNVVAVLDAGFAPIDGFDADVPWMVLEWLEGETLRDSLLARRGRGGRTPAECMDLLRPVFEAIADAHDAGIVHRDLKPSNIMLVPDRRGVDARVLDFGIAKMMKHEPTGDPSSGHTATQSRTSSFTVASAAPEQLSGSRTGPWTDVYALALLVTEVLTDRAPMGVVDPNDHYRKVFDGERPTPRALGVDCGAWEAVLARALAVRPNERQADARKLLADLESTLPDALATPLERASESSVDGGYSATDRRAAEAIHQSASTKKSAAMTAGGPSMRGGRSGTSTRSRVGLAAVAITVIASATGVAVVAMRSRATGSTGAASGAPNDASALGCTGNRACVEAHGGEPWMCRATDRTCVAIGSEDCAARFEPEDLAADDTLWIGAMLPLSGPRADAYGKQAANALDLARRDFANVGGVPGPTEGRMRRLALVVCDATTNARRPAAHLADLDVAVVLGPAVGLKDTIDVTTNVFVPKRMLVLDLFDESPLVTQIPQPEGVPRLVWRLTASAEQGGEALAHVVSDYVEPLLRRRGGPLADGKPMKLVIVRSESATPASILDAFASTLRMNGKPLVENTAQFQQQTFRRNDLSPSARRNIVADIVAFSPNVIIYADGPFFEDPFVEAIERDWKTPSRPIYVSQGVLANAGLRTFVGANAERRRRFLSTELPANTDENFRFVLHYNELFEPKITPGTAPGTIFDVFYVAAYAAAATKKAHVTGADLAEAMRRLGGEGERIGVGPSHIFEAYEILRQGKTLRLSGAGTQLDFDHAAGDIPSDFAVYCFGIDRDGRASEPRESGLRFDHRSKRLEGTMRCP